MDEMTEIARRLAAIATELSRIGERINALIKETSRAVDKK